MYIYMYIYIYVYIYINIHGIFQRGLPLGFLKQPIQVRGQKNGHRQEITNELLPSLVVDHPTGFAPLDALVAAVTGLTGRGHRGEIYGVQKGKR
jgi:hypothetical protein